MFHYNTNYKIFLNYLPLAAYAPQVKWSLECPSPSPVSFKKIRTINL